MIKKNPTYRVTVFKQNDAQNPVIIEYPITCKFNCQRATFSNANKCTIELYNLAESTRTAIFKDALVGDLEEQNWKFVRLEAGWNVELSQIFFGRILQAYSTKEGGQADIITRIECLPFDIFSSQSSYTFAEGTSYKEAYKTMASDLPNCQVANTGRLEGSFKTQTTFEGKTVDCLNELTGGNTFVDNGRINTILSNEVIDVPVPLVTYENGLLATPIRRNATITIKMLFEPTLIVGQLLEIQSNIQKVYNGQFKVLGFTHDCTISPTQAGTRITTVELWAIPLLTSTNINVTNEEVTGAAAKVNGDEVTPIQEDVKGIAAVYTYIQKNGKAPHTKVTNNIWWDEVVKTNSLAYGKPSISELTSLYYTSYRIQTFVDKYYPGSKIQINSGWRSKGYNATLKNADPNSEHLYGNAIDFAIIGQNMNKVYAKFKTYWKGRRYLHSSYGFIHADITSRRGIVADW